LAGQDTEPLTAGGLERPENLIPRPPRPLKPYLDNNYIAFVMIALNHHA
jgi:hypothetical protein